MNILNTDYNQALTIEFPDSGSIHIHSIRFFPPLSNTFLLPQFPLTASLEAECDWFQHPWSEAGFTLEAIDSEGNSLIIPMIEVKLDAPRRQYKAMFLPPQPGLYSLTVRLTLAAQYWTLFNSQVNICEPRSHETWTQRPMITKVDSHLYIGNAAAAANPKLDAHESQGILERWNIRAVLNAAEERDPHLGLLDSGIDYGHFPFEDFSHNPLQEERLWDAVCWIADYVEKKESVFVHCHAGIGRSGSVVTAYLLLYRYPKLSFDDIVHRINTTLKSKAHYIIPHVGIPESVNRLRAQRSVLEPTKGIVFHEEKIGKVHSIAFERLSIGHQEQKDAPEIRPDEQYTLRKGMTIEFRVRVDYIDFPPQGVYLFTNLNRDGPPFEKILMEPMQEENGLFIAWVTPERSGENLWLTAYATPRRYDHDLLAKWIGHDLHFKVLD